MPDRRRSSLNFAVLLSSVEDAPPIAAAEVFATALAKALDARDVSFLIADFSGRSLVRLSHVGRRDGTARRAVSARNRALKGRRTARARRAERRGVAEDGAQPVFAPVSSRGEAIGVLELGLDHPPDEQTLAAVADAAHALAYVVIANRRFTDLFEWGQRSMPLSLEAEIQHRLLPGSYTCEAGQFTLAGWLEPAGDVGGDTFDFSLDRDTLHLSMTDAMGHTLEAALLATVLVGALRNARRARRRARPAGLPRSPRTWQLHITDGRVRDRAARARRSAVGHAHASSTPAIRRRSASAPERPRRSSCAPIRRSPWPRRGNYEAQELCCRPATDSCSSPTACSNATRQTSTSRR